MHSASSELKIQRVGNNDIISDLIGFHFKTLLKLFYGN